jgi:hypothetical protein
VHEQSNFIHESPAGFERRRERRYAVRCDCWLERDDTTIYGTTADVGMGGVFLRTAIPIRPGDQFDVRLYINGAPDPVVARGMVARSILARSGMRYGVGVAFTSIREGQAELKSFLESGSALLS